MGNVQTNVMWNGCFYLRYFWPMIAVEFPPPAFRIKTEKGKDCIFDPLRKKWLVLTPEEWVRQNFVQYFIQVLHYPASLIGVEKGIKLGELKKRFDIVVCNQDTKPWMLVECKAMEIPLSGNVADQILRYNQTMEASFVVITNGVFTRCFQLQPQVNELFEMPEWNS